MASQEKSRQDKTRPGSNPEDARKVGGAGDFGVSEKDVNERQYTSANTKASDPGAAQPHAGAQGGRTSGVGGNASGPGSSSGGDVDTDIVGVGTGGSTISASGVTHRPPGPDDSDGSSGEFASGPPAKGENQRDVHQVGGKKKVDGNVADPMDVRDGSVPGAQGADAATNPEARHDDAFSGEVSACEAGGQGGQ
jgi:hypothetical protein